MTDPLKEAFRKTLVRWTVCFSVVSGILFYHGSAPVGAILIAGLATLIMMLYLTYRSSKSAS